MIRIIAALWFLGWVAAALAQSLGGMAGVGGQSPSPSLPAVSYTGPGDIVSGATTFVGLTAYNAAYATGSNPAADVCDTATFMTCSTINILSSGYFDTATAAASPACASACVIKKLYDQTGNGNHWQVSVAIAIRGPALTFNCLGSRPCLTSSSQVNLNQVTTAGASQPFTLERVAINSNGGSGGNFFFYPTNNVQANYVTNLATCFGGAGATATASDAAWHFVNTVFNSTSSDIHVDGTQNTIDCGTNTAAGTPDINDNGAFLGQMMEWGMWPSAISSGNSNSMSANRKTVYGY